MNRRDFLGILGKGAIALTIPLSVMSALPDTYNKNVEVIAKHEEGDLISVAVSYKKNNQTYCNALLIGSDEQAPIKTIAKLFNQWLGFNGVSEKQINNALGSLKVRKRTANLDRLVRSV